MEQLRKTCFFCSEEIDDKKTLEHIIPNGLLAKLGIKEEAVAGEKYIQYSRVKVPAHASCNNGFGSKYEERVLALLEDTDALFQAIKQTETDIPIRYGVEDDETAIITTWLSKIYYGLFYYDYLRTQDASWREICSTIINSQNLNLVRESYKNGYGFQLPSSLYVFKTNNEQFDLTTIVDPSAILIKIKSITLILCICDGYLTKKHLNGVGLERLRSNVSYNDGKNIDFPAHKLAFAEILAIRSSIPKPPSFIFNDKEMINMSLFANAKDPNKVYRIDDKIIDSHREKYFEQFNIRME
jgi:hypothetical protein